MPSVQEVPQEGAFRMQGSVSIIIVVVVVDDFCEELESRHIPMTSSVLSGQRA